MADKTHREVKNPQISARYLADFMAATETAKRTIVRGCKYQPIARVVQHNEAKAAVAKFLRDGLVETALLNGFALQLRERLADNDFDRDLYDHNADYVDRFAEVFPSLEMPVADLLAPGKVVALELNGTKVTADLSLRLRRLTKTNKVRVGAAMLRYAKGKVLPPAVAEWQSAFIHGYLNAIGLEPATEPELKLCLTVDAYSGKAHPAPTDSVQRFKHMQAACKTIAERWPNIDPPPKAVL
jgi:hypothetical protein